LEGSGFFEVLCRIAWGAERERRAVGWVLVFSPFYGKALDDRARGGEFVESDGAFSGMGLGLYVDGEDGGLDFEGVYWCGFEGGADEAEASPLDMF